MPKNRNERYTQYTDDKYKQESVPDDNRKRDRYNRNSDRQYRELFLRQRICQVIKRILIRKRQTEMVARRRISGLAVVSDGRFRLSSPTV